MSKIKQNEKSTAAAAQVLIVVDMQHDFTDGPLGTAEAKKIVEKIRKKADAAAEAGRGIVFTMDTHTAEETENTATVEASMIPAHCIRNTAGWQIVEQLRPFAKTTYEKPAFTAIGIAGILADYISDRPDCEIELCGVCTDICVISNALYLRAKFPGVQITVDSACCAGTTPERHIAALEVMKSCLIQVR